MHSPNVWLQARTFLDFGEATALWLEKQIDHMPTAACYLYPNDETKPLVPILNRLNRSGKLVTTFSQPACLPNNRPLDGIMDTQRAAMSAFVAPEHYRAVQSVLAFEPRLVFLAHPPGSPSRESHVLVSRNEGKDISWTGYVQGTDRIARRYNGLHPDVIVALQQAWQIDICDMEWGRNDILWPLLEKLC